MIRRGPSVWAVFVLVASVVVRQPPAEQANSVTLRFEIAFASADDKSPRITEISGSDSRATDKVRLASGDLVTISTRDDEDKQWALDVWEATFVMNNGRDPVKAQ